MNFACLALSCAASEVLTDVNLLHRILWSRNALSIRDLCIAACEQRTWRAVAHSNPKPWSELLIAALPHAALPGFCDDAALRRTVVQLYRLGVASPQPSLLVPFLLSDYAFHADVTDSDSNTVARFVLCLGELALPRKHPTMKAHTEELRDGGAAAGRFLARLRCGDADSTELVLRTWLTRADGARCMLYNEHDSDDAAALTWASASTSDAQDETVPGFFNHVTEARLKPWQRMRIMFWNWSLRLSDDEQETQLSHACQATLTHPQVAVETAMATQVRSKRVSRLTNNADASAAR